MVRRISFKDYIWLKVEQSGIPPCRSIEKQQFPKQVSLGDRAVAWVESEVQAWVIDRVVSR
ncbi:AlpA family phage regulatory protein [Motilimonas eburnea]|uniref:AlpA family phage regulatory protein n=1 Tax=Motilimonas eburnea TaxID=1737488 RepID=UPI002551F96F|nr:AlpA family phage regulatory protein [Motilimonas eburnea]